MGIKKASTLFCTWDYSESTWKMYESVEDAVHANASADKEVEVYVMAPVLHGVFKSRKVVDRVLPPVATQQGNGNGGNNG